MQKKKVKVGILGTGNIGSDLLVKIQRSEILECGMFAGKNPDSVGIKRAKAMGVRTSSNSLKALEDDPNCCDIVIDATSAHAHLRHAPILEKLGKFTIDMTPSRIGKMCIPVLNLADCLKVNNVNIVTCGGQATIPMIAAIKKVHPELKYVEVVGSIASKSAGMGTRDNVDEYTQTTSEGIKYFTHVSKAKTIIILNPAEPPIIMHNTIFAEIENPNLELLTKELGEAVTKIKKYVPAYEITKPVYENNRLTLINRVVGCGDFLPKYAGNLDIVTSSAVAIAEEYAKLKLQ